jgi:NitT/TauT family transport system substrate-binding protein
VAVKEEVTMRFLNRRITFAAIATLVLAACGESTSTSTTPQASTAPTALTLMVGGLNKQIYLPNMLTQQLGYFKAENLDVTLVDEGSGQGSEEALIAKQVQAASGSYSHTIELQPKGKFIETVCQFGIAPGEAEMVSTKHPEILTPADLKGKNLGVTSIGSGTQTVTSAIVGKAGLSPTNDVKFVPVGAGSTFIAAMKQGTIDAGMTTEPTISRLIAAGDAKILVNLLTPANTRKALGGDYPFIGIFMENDYVAANKGTTQHLVNAYVKTLKWMKSHSADEIASKMPADYYAGDKVAYVAALKNQLSIFGSDCKMPQGGPETVLKIDQDFVASMKGKTADLSKSYTNEFANKAS